MNETMGQIIRRLRKERNLTQEELAEQLNITYQAVSRWENETGMPDISQIVPLANVFGVSTDVLFGTSIENSAEEVDAFIKELHLKQNNKPNNISSFSHHKECCEDIQKMLSLYPNDFKLLACSLDIMVTLLWDYWDNRFANEMPNSDAEVKDLYKECIRQANVILHHCTDIQHLDFAHRRLVSVYRIMGEFEKAEEHAKQVVDYNGFQLGVVYDNNGRTEDAMKQYIHTLYAKLMQLEPVLPTLGYLYRKQQKFEEAYSCYRLQIDVFERILGNEPYPFGNRSYDWCAAICVKLGRYDEAMDWLEKWIEAERNNRTSNTTSELPYFYGLDLKPVAQSNQVLASLEWDLFDPIRNTERFQKILASAESLKT